MFSKASVNRVRLIALIGASLASGIALGQQPPEVQLRLRPGNYWVYRGVVEWTYISTPEQQARNLPPRLGKKRIVWKSQILEQATRGDLKAYLVKGSFDDLPWYEPGRTEQQYLWIVYKNRFYTLAIDSGLLRRFRDPTDSLVSAVLKEEPVLQFPLRLSQCTTPIAPDEPRQRDDLFYCWHLEDKKRMEQTHIPGVTGSPTVWKAWYRTMPDHQIYGFAPGWGFISYDFSHHGTLSEAHVKLVEAHLR